MFHPDENIDDFLENGLKFLLEMINTRKKQKLKYSSQNHANFQSQKAKFLRSSRKIDLYKKSGSRLSDVIQRYSLYDSASRYYFRSR